MEEQRDLPQIRRGTISKALSGNEDSGKLGMTMVMHRDGVIDAHYGKESRSTSILENEIGRKQAFSLGEVQGTLY